MPPVWVGWKLQCNHATPKYAMCGSRCLRAAAVDVDSLSTRVHVGKREDEREEIIANSGESR
jgi:hypothetical protein